MEQEEGGGSMVPFFMLEPKPLLTGALDQTENAALPCLTSPKTKWTRQAQNIGENTELLHIHRCLFPTPPLILCVTAGKSLNVYDPQFVHLQNGNSNVAPLTGF